MTSEIYKGVLSALIVVGFMIVAYTVQEFGWRPVAKVLAAAVGFLIAAAVILFIVILSQPFQ